MIAIYEPLASGTRSRRFFAAGLIVCLMLILPAMSAAARAGEQTGGKEGFVLKDGQVWYRAEKQGKEKYYKVTLEVWRNHLYYRWVARDEQGRIVKATTGRVETWKDGIKRQVLRNEKMELLAWVFDYSHGIKVDLSLIQPINKYISLAVFIVVDKRFPSLDGERLTLPVSCVEGELMEGASYILSTDVRLNKNHDIELEGKIGYTTYKVEPVRKEGYHKAYMRGFRRGYRKAVYRLKYRLED